MLGTPSDLLANVSVEGEYEALLPSGFCLKDFAATWLDVLAKLHLLYHDFVEENISIRFQLSYFCYLLYSALIDSDKYDAAEIKELERLSIPADLVDRYCASRFRSRATKWKGYGGRFIRKLQEKLYCVLERNIYFNRSSSA